jgi:hypothetical protein
MPPLICPAANLIRETHELSKDFCGSPPVSGADTAGESGGNAEGLDEKRYRLAGEDRDNLRLEIFLDVVRSVAFDECDNGKRQWSRSVHASHRGEALQTFE